MTKVFTQIDNENKLFEKTYEEKINHLKLIEDKITQKFEEETRVTLPI